MFEPGNPAISCPRCDTPMILGHLKDPANVIYIESLRSFNGSALLAWICPKCGHVELQATEPEDLADRGIPDEDLNPGRDDWNEWEEDL